MWKKLKTLTCPTGHVLSPQEWQLWHVADPTRAGPYAAVPALGPECLIPSSRIIASL